jgi:hypothetical protein
MSKGWRTWAGAAATAVLLSCASLKTNVGWDKQADFAAYRTWSWKDDGSIRDPVWSRRVQAVLEDELGKHGLTRSEGKADLWVAVHWRLSVDTRVVSYDPAWGYAGNWGYWTGPSVTEIYEVPAGTMLIDLVDVGKKRLVWRASASGEIRPDRENEEREQKLREILSNLFAGYPPARS